MRRAEGVATVATFTGGPTPGARRGSRTVLGSWCGDARRAFRPRAIRIDDGGHRRPRSPRRRHRRAARPDEESAILCPATDLLESCDERHRIRVVEMVVVTIKNE